MKRPDQRESERGVARNERQRKLRNQGVEELKITEIFEGYGNDDNEELELYCSVHYKRKMYIIKIDYRALGQLFYWINRIEMGSQHRLSESYDQFPSAPGRERFVQHNVEHRRYH